MAAERLSCEIDAELKTAIGRFGLTLSVKKGYWSKAYRALLAHAFDNPEHPIREFPEDEMDTATLEADQAVVSKLDAYQQHHQLGERRRGFKSALLRGWSYHLDQQNGPPTAP